MQAGQVYAVQRRPHIGRKVDPLQRVVECEELAAAESSGYDGPVGMPPQEVNLKAAVAYAMLEEVQTEKYFGRKGFWVAAHGAVGSRSRMDGESYDTLKETGL